MPQSIFLLVAANLALSGCFGWKWILWPVTTWLAVQLKKVVFFLTLHDSINDIKQFRNFCITPQPCHSHLFLIAANLALIGFLGWKWSLWLVPTRLALQRMKVVYFLILYDSINDMKIFWNDWLHLCRATSMFVVAFCLFVPTCILWLKMELIACLNFVHGKIEQSCIFPNRIWYYQWYETIPKCLHHNPAVPQKF